MLARTGFEDDDSSIDDVNFETGDDDLKDKRKAYQIDYRTLTVQEIEQRQTDDAESTAGVLAITPAEAVLLLRHWGWNKDKLIEVRLLQIIGCIYLVTFLTLSAGRFLGLHG